MHRTSNATTTGSSPVGGTKIMKPSREDIKKNRFNGVAPDGFTLVRNEVLEELKNFDTWKSWKNEEISLYDLDKRDISE